MIDSDRSVFHLGLEKYVPVTAVRDGLVNDKQYSGGPAGLLYGFIIVWAGTAAVFASLCELASMYASMDTI